MTCKIIVVYKFNYVIFDDFFENILIEYYISIFVKLKLKKAIRFKRSTLHYLVCNVIDCSSIHNRLI